MKQSKRFLALVLAVLMICGAAIPALASDDTQEPEVETTAAVIDDEDAGEAADPDADEAEDDEDDDDGEDEIKTLADDEEDDDEDDEELPAAEGYINRGNNFGTPTEVSSTYANGTYATVMLVENENGPTLAYSTKSGVTILEEEATGLYFKDLNQNGILDDYEDWRLSTEERAWALVELMGEDEEIGLQRKLALMTHGSSSTGFGVNDGRRFVLTKGTGKGTLADSNNATQLAIEGVEWGIPGVYSTDPRHTGIIDAGYFDGYDTTISRWPNQLSLSSTFDPDAIYRYGEIVAAEYRAVGITMQLGPMIDMVTDPRWSRAGSSWSEDYQLSADLAGAMIEAMQTDAERGEDDWGINDGWGPNSVAIMAKHWSSGGASEFGYEAHNDDGKFAVYPGDQFHAAAEAFAEGAGFDAETGSPRQASAAMPTYTIAWGQTDVNWGAGFDSYVLNDMLRDKYDWDGLITSDWLIHSGGMAWGLENSKGYTETYRLLMSFLVGLDQSGGYSSVSGIAAAYEMGVNGSETFGVEPLGEEFMNALVDKSAYRALYIIFNTGMFENPYADPDYADGFVGSFDLNEEAFEVHRGSVVMLKNSDGTLPIETSETAPKVVYTNLTVANNGSVSTSYTQDMLDAYNYTLAPTLQNALSLNRALTDAEKVQAAAEADFAILAISSPNQPNNGKVAQNLTYSPYTATKQREVSIGYDWYYDEACTQIVQHYDYPSSYEEGIAKGYTRSNRSRNGTTHAGTPATLSQIEEMVELMGGKEIVVILNQVNPMVPSDFEPYVDVILSGQSTSPQAFLEVISGAYEPTGLLAATMPLSMNVVELAYEDTPHDMTAYYDADGNFYQFGFGLNYSGPIRDDRTDKYVDEWQEYVPVESISLSVAALTSMRKNATLQVSASMVPANNTYATEDVVWSSSNENVLTIDENGLVTAHKVGSATISATSPDGSVTKMATIRVSA